MDSYRYSLNLKRKFLFEKFLDNTIIAKNGGLFKINENFLCFLSQIKETTQFILDMNNNPIFIDNIQEFYQQAYKQYFTSLEEFAREIDSLKKQRNKQSLIS